MTLFHMTIFHILMVPLSMALRRENSLAVPPTLVSRRLVQNMSPADIADAQNLPTPGAGTASEAEALFRHHGGWLIGFLQRRFGPDAAEDLAQEAFVRTVGTRTDIRNPRAFLARLAVRAASDQARGRSARLATCPADDADAAVRPVQFEAVLLQQLLRELPPKVRDVYLLCRVAGLTYGEVAQRCGISVKRVEARMTEAHRRFAALMRD